MRWNLLSTICLVGCSWPALADDWLADSFPLRHHNPFLQIYGLPPFQSGRLVEPGRFEWEMRLDISNDEDDATRGDKFIEIDAESTVAVLSIRRRWQRFELGVDLPFVRHASGFLDRPVERWHSVFGISNKDRAGPNGEFGLMYGQGDVTLFELNSPVSGVGDVQLAASIPVRNMVFRTAIKLPTGDPDKLTGSGAADVSIGLYRTGSYQYLQRDFSVSGMAGVLFLGQGDVLPELQRDVVPFGGLALRWQATPRIGLLAQLYAQGPYFESAIDELGGNSFQLSIGADFRARDLLWRLAIVEDITSHAVPDFALHLSVRVAAP